MTAGKRPWHLCDSTGATTRGRWRTRDELAADMRAAYGQTLPRWLGQPCNRPLVPNGYRHLEPAADVGRLPAEP